MALNSLRLAVAIVGSDLLSRPAGRAERSMGKLTKSVGFGANKIRSQFKLLGAGMATFAAGAAGVLGAIGMASVAGKFEQGLAAVGAVTRATSKEMQMLRDAAIQAGVDTQFSPTEAVDGLQSLTTAWQSASEAVKSLTPVLDLAAGSLGQLGVAQAAEAVVGTLNAFGKSADEAGAVTDKLLRITQMTNFQARDFAGGLAKAAATGGVFRQSLDDTLITMGLLKNQNIDASSASTAYREAVRRAGSDQRSQQAIQSVGVQIFDKQTGKMRSMVDVMTDFAKGTQNMTDKQRSATVSQAFGARGLIAFNAVMNATHKVMRDGELVTLKGAEAIESLRKEMTNSSGAAKEMREKMLNTFAGQGTLLKGTLQTLGIVIGEPFAKIFKPIVGGIVKFFNVILQAINKTPMGIKKFFAGMFVAVSSLVATIGAVIAAKAAFALLVIGLKMVGAVLGTVALTLAPVIIGIGLAIAAGVALYYAYKKNLGGIADFVQKLSQKVQLAFEAIGQLFNDGGFSGAVLQDFEKAENGGVKSFVITLWKMFHRLKQIWRGMKLGFKLALTQMEPVFKGLKESVGALFDTFKTFYEMFTGNASSLPSRDYRDFGQTIGDVLGSVAKFAVKLITWFIDGIRYVTIFFGGIIAGIKPVGEWLGQLAFDIVSFFTDTIPNAWNDAVDWIARGIGKVVGFFVRIWNFAKGIARKIAQGFMWFFSPVINFYRGLFNGIRAGFQRIWGFIKSVLKKVPDALLPEALVKFKAEAVGAPSSPAVTSAAPGVGAGQTPITAEYLRERTKALGNRQLAIDSDTVPRDHLERQREPQPPVHISLEVDGEKLASVVHEADESSAERAFSPVPVF